MKRTLIVFIVTLICFQSYAQKPRARDLGIPFVGITGEFNAITDVKGVEVGYSTRTSLEKVRLELESQQYFQKERRKNSVLYMPIGTV